MAAQKGEKKGESLYGRLLSQTLILSPINCFALPVTNSPIKMTRQEAKDREALMHYHVSLATYCPTRNDHIFFKMHEPNCFSCSDYHIKRC